MRVDLVAIDLVRIDLVTPRHSDQGWSCLEGKV